MAPQQQDVPAEGTIGVDGHGVSTRSLQGAGVGKVLLDTRLTT